MISKGLFFSFIVVAATLGGLAGFLIAHYAVQPLDNAENSNVADVTGVSKLVGLDPSEDNITQFILNEVDPERLRDVLRNLTTKPHIAGSDQNLALAEYLRDLWSQYGIPDVKLQSYDVLLSRVERDDPNVISIINEDNGEAVLTLVGIQPPIYTPEEADTGATPSYNAYATAGKVSGDLVYANYGRGDDFLWLIDQGIDLVGKIIIARYGMSFRGNIVKYAEQYGAAGVIIFSDPHEFASEGRNWVYPDAFWLPGTGTQCGTLLIPNGDPSTFRYPSVEGAYRIPEDKMDAPHIPVQPVGYDDAEQLLSLLVGPVPPSDWIGDLDVSYNVGPGYANKSLKVVVDVKTHNLMETIYHVIGIIPGAIEPDRYVILGNHRDAWIFGGIDPSSGTTVLTELARVFGELLATGWRPRRTLVFGSWGAEEFATVGSTEWVEDNAKLLGERAVAYLNVDVSVEGNFTLRVNAVPSLNDLVFETAKKIPNPNSEEIAAGRLTVYDTWLYTSYNQQLPPENASPNISVVGSGSDFTPFIYFVGVTSLDYSYIADPNVYLAGNPLYHSLYETFYAFDTLVDPGSKYQVSMTQLWAETARALADTAVIPLSVTSYAADVETAFNGFSEDYGPYLNQQGISLDFFLQSVKNFTNTASIFNASLATTDFTDPLVLRKINDQIMQVERAFIEPEGLPLTPGYKHVILSPSSSDQYAGQYFSGLVDILIKIQSSSEPTSLWETFKQHLAAVTYYIQSAANVLNENL